MGFGGVTAIRIKSTTLFCTMLILQPSVVHLPRNNPPWWVSTMTSSWNALLNKGLWIQIYAFIYLSPYFTTTTTTTTTTTITITTTTTTTTTTKYKNKTLTHILN